MVATITLSSTACASSGGGSPGTIEEAYGALSAESAVGQFLDAAQRADYQVMTHLFGTRNGPAIEKFGRVEIEQRMFVLAALLKHESYSIHPASLAAGEGEKRLAVDMVGTRNGDVTVPIIAAFNKGRWFVQQIQTKALTGG